MSRSTIGNQESRRNFKNPDILGDAPLIQFDTCSVALWYYAGEFRTTDSLIAFGKDHFPIGSNVKMQQAEPLIKQFVIFQITVGR